MARSIYAQSMGRNFLPFRALFRLNYRHSLSLDTLHLLIRYTQTPTATYTMLSKHCSHYNIFIEAICQVSSFMSTRIG